MSDHSTQPVEYRPVPGWPGYRVGDDGTVWSNKIRGVWKKLSPGMSRGYLQVVFVREGKRFTIRVHCLVLLSFGIERPSKNHQTRHLNSVRSDNRLCNLAWGTAKENSDDKEINGTMKRGDKHASSILSDRDIHEIRYCFPELSCAKLGKKFGVTSSCVWLIRKKINWKHLP